MTSRSHCDQTPDFPAIVERRKKSVAKKIKQWNERNKGVRGETQAKAAGHMTRNKQSSILALNSSLYRIPLSL